MITLTTPHNMRCSLPPSRIVAVQGGSPTVVLLDTGVAIPVREAADEVTRRLDEARGRSLAAADHGRAR